MWASVVVVRDGPTHGRQARPANTGLSEGQIAYGWQNTLALDLRHAVHRALCMEAWQPVVRAATVQPIIDHAAMVVVAVVSCMAGVTGVAVSVVVRADMVRLYSEVKVVGVGGLVRVAGRMGQRVTMRHVRQVRCRRVVRRVAVRRLADGRQSRVVLMHPAGFRRRHIVRRMAEAVRMAVGMATVTVTSMPVTVSVAVGMAVVVVAVAVAASCLLVADSW